MFAPYRTCTLTLSHLAIFEQVEPGLNFIVISVSMKVITVVMSMGCYFAALNLALNVLLILLLLLVTDSQAVPPVQ